MRHRALALAAAALLCGACRLWQPALRVGTSGDYPPFSRAGEGFDVDVARRFARERGYRIEWVRFRWPELQQAVRERRFDVAMSGVSWSPERGVYGYLTRAVAAGGPCLVGDPSARRIAVNRGGALERWARQRFPEREIRSVDSNLELAEPLRRREVDAFVTDRFELPYVRDAGWQVQCAPPSQRKVYWVTEARAGDIGRLLDAWLERHERELAELRQRWFGVPESRDAADHLIDLLARRLAFMPAVGRAKRAAGLPLEDPAQEGRVQETVRAAAARAHLEAPEVEALFRMQIELAKRVQARAAPGPAELDLKLELRPTVADLSERIVAALAKAAPIARPALDADRLAPLSEILEPSEVRELLAALALVRAPLAATSVFRMQPANRGTERYAAWFADSDGRVLYFGLSPFWDLWWSSGDPTAELRERGDLLIGRFDLEREAFLAPLLVRSGARGSVWDVLVHSSGRILYTTLFEEAGSVGPEGEDPQPFTALGAGLNELWEGPDGLVYATRYGRAQDPASGRHGGAVVVFTATGELVREIPLPLSNGAPAPKSLAVDPASGEVWLNTDTFEPERVAHEALRLGADGRVLERHAGSPELHFVYFDRAGTGWFAEAERGELSLRVQPRAHAGRELAIGSLAPLDFAQEIHPTASGGVLVALWSGRVVHVESAGDGFACGELRFELPADCRPPAGRAALYSVVQHGPHVYATLACGATVLRAPLPAADRRCERAAAGAE